MISDAQQGQQAQPIGTPAEQWPKAGFTSGTLTAVAGVLVLVGVLPSAISDGSHTTTGAAILAAALAVIVGVVVVAAIFVDWRSALRDGKRDRDAAEQWHSLQEQLSEIREGFVVVEELMERLRDLEADLASFRLWHRTQVAHQPKMIGNGRAGHLRPLSDHPE